MQGGRSRKGSAATNRSGFVTARCRAPLGPAEPHGEGMWALPGEREPVGDGTERKVTRGRAEVEKWGWVGQERLARLHGAGGQGWHCRDAFAWLRMGARLELPGFTIGALQGFSPPAGVPVKAQLSLARNYS